MSVLDNPITVVFASNDLNQVPGLLVLDRGDLEPGKRELKQFKLARTSKSVLTTAEYVSKQIPITAAITRSSRELLEASLDTLYSLLQDFESTLDIRQSGADRRYQATVASVKIVNTKGGYAKVGITFECSDPFGTDLEQSTLLDGSTDTTGSATFQIAVGGSAEVRPIITLEFDDLTDGTDATVSVVNSQTGVGISVTRDWVNGDVLEIDGQELAVRVNGIDINPDGKIPIFIPGLRQIGYTDNFTARTMTIGAVYTKKYI